MESAAHKGVRSMDHGILWLYGGSIDAGWINRTHGRGALPQNARAR